MGLFCCLVCGLCSVLFCFVARPIKPLEWWGGGEILGVRDEMAGGTWLASFKLVNLLFLLILGRSNQSLKLGGGETSLFVFCSYL